MPTNYKALLIGNGSFDDPKLESLRGPANDLTALERALTDAESGLFAPGTVNVLRDRSRGEVALEIERFFCSAGREDLLLLYYSGHGKVTPQGGFYFCVRDTISQFLEATAVSRQNLLGAIQRCRSDRIVLVLDCCHAGALKGAEQMPFSVDDRGNYFMYATGAKAVALDADLSPFTEVFVEALTRSESDHKDGYVSVDAIYSYVNAELRARYAQSPQKAVRGQIAELPLARSKREAPARIGLSRQRIVLQGVSPWEPIQELVEVRNLGGGELKWSASSHANWIETIEQAPHLKLRIQPLPERNRSEVRVYQHGTSKYEVIEIITDTEPPQLEPLLGTRLLEFGNQIRAQESVWHEIDVYASDAVEVDPTSVPDWATVELLPKRARIRVCPRRLGKLEATVKFRARGRDASLTLRCTGVAQGPVLAVSPDRIDFGEVCCGSHSAPFRVQIANRGGGQLEARIVYFPHWIRVKPTAQAGELQLRARPRRAGREEGQIQVASNGGEAVIAVCVTGRVRAGEVTT